MKRMMPQSCRCMLIAGSVLVGLMVVAGMPAAPAFDVTPTTSSSERNWDKKLPGAARFTVLSAFGDAAVRDDETGLVWEKTVETTEMSWTDARARCADKDVGGRKGWRLPSISELASLVD